MGNSVGCGGGSKRSEAKKWSPYKEMQVPLVYEFDLRFLDLLCKVEMLMVYLLVSLCKF